MSKRLPKYVLANRQRLKRLITHRAGEAVGKRSLSSLAGRIRTILWSAISEFSPKSQVNMTFGQTIPLLGIYSIDKPTHVPNKVFIYSVSFITAMA